MIRTKLEIICKEYKHKKLVNGKIKVNKSGGEYYIIPITKQYQIDDDGEYLRLTFNNQLLLLRYSNHWKEILIKDNDFTKFTDFIIIESKNIYDIYMELHTNNFLRKSVWHSDNSVNLNNIYNDKYVLALPIIEDMIQVKKHGTGTFIYQIKMITNEMLMKKTTARSKSNCNICVTNNFLLNSDAIFIRLNDDEVQSFIT